MAGRQSRDSRWFNKAKEDMRRPMRGEMTEMEDKLRSAAKLMILKEREAWTSERQQLLNNNRKMQERLSITEEENRKLKANLQKARDEIGRRKKETGSLLRDFSALEQEYNQNFAWKKDFKKEREKAMVEIKKRDEEIVSLLQRVVDQQEEIERVRASADQWKQSSEMRTTEETWQQEISQLKEVIKEKEKEIRRVEKKREARTKAHLDTLALLTSTESALKQSQQTCDALEEKLREQLAEKDERHQKELSEKEDSFKKKLSGQVQQFKKLISDREKYYTKELSDRELKYKKTLSDREESMRKQLSERGNLQHEHSDGAMTSRKEMSELCERWERKARQWAKEKKELEETLLIKEKVWNHEEAIRKEEIEYLKKTNSQLQELITKNQQQQSFWSWSLFT